MTQRHFFATLDDLLPVFERAEGKLDLSYTLAGLGKSPHVTTSQAGVSLPSLRLPAESSATDCATYLVMPRGLPVNVRPISQRAGGILYAVDQLVNPDSITLTHGGLFAPEVLISGRIATVSNTPSAKAIQSAFSNAIGKLFTRINAFWVGPLAAEMLARGFRLTQAVQSPLEYDLRGEPNNSFKPNLLRKSA